MPRLFVPLALIFAVLASIAPCLVPAAAAQTANPFCDPASATCVFLPLVRRASTPLSIQPIASLPGNATVVSAKDGFAYTNFGDTLSVVDVRVPTKPQIVRQITLPGKFNQKATAVALQGNQAYVATRYVFTSCCLSGGVVVFNIQQPPATTMLGTIGTEGLSDLTVNGSSVFVTGQSWVSAASELAIYDVSTPTAPTRRSSIGDRGSNAVAVAGSSAYVTARGIQIFDVSNPAAPTLQSTLPITNVFDLAVDDTHLYAMTLMGDLLVFDRSIPTAPVLVGQAAIGGEADRIQVVDGRVFVAQGEAGIAAVDLTLPSQPQVVATYDTPGTAADVWADGSIIYVADGSAGLQVLQMTPTP